MILSSFNRYNGTTRKMMALKLVLSDSKFSTSKKYCRNITNYIHRQWAERVHYSDSLCRYNKIEPIRMNYYAIIEKRSKKNMWNRFPFSTSSFKNEDKVGNFAKGKIEEIMEKEMLEIKKKAAKEKRTHQIALVLLSLSLLGLVAFYESYNPEFFVYDIALRFCLNYLDSEFCHDLFIWMGKYKLLPHDTSNDSVYSTSEIKQLKFLNPFGVAAGFDKNGESIEGLLKLGFSFIEVGTITPKDQEGNKKPRIFRDNKTKSVINSCGFNNIGCDAVTENIKEFRKKQKTEKLLNRHIVGVSIGKNKNSTDIIDDLTYCVNKVGKYADYIAINVSSPNTPGLRDNQEAGQLRKIICHIKTEINKLNEASTSKTAYTKNIYNVENTINIAKNELENLNNVNNAPAVNKQNEVSSNTYIDAVDKKHERRNNDASIPLTSSASVSLPLNNVHCADSCATKTTEPYWQNTTKEKPLLFVKLSPDLSENERKQIAQVLLEEKIDGMIISNTTIQDLNIECFKDKKGGISGSKLKDISTKMISDMYLYTNKQVPIMASGGIMNGEDALQKIEAGASVCQLYSSLVFNGVKTAVQMKREFENLLYRKGYYNLNAAIGASHKKNPRR